MYQEDDRGIAPYEIPSGQPFVTLTANEAWSISYAATLLQGIANLYRSVKGEDETYRYAVSVIEQGKTLFEDALRQPIAKHRLTEWKSSLASTTDSLDMTPTSNILYLNSGGAA